MELSVIISIAASAVVGFLGWTQPVNITDAQKTIETRKSIETIAKAIESFKVEKGRLPCPADPQMRVDNTHAGTDNYPNDFGTEDLDVIQTTVGGLTTLGVDCPVTTGSIPAYSLGLSRDFINDAWGRRITYKVSDNLCGADAGTDAGGAALSDDASRTKGCTSKDYAEGSGNVTVTNVSGTSLTINAAYVLVSHGPNGYGAYLPSGAKLANGPNATETENSDNDAVFIKDNKSGTFDDVTFFKTKVQVQRLTDHQNMKQISVADCEANSQLLKDITLSDAVDLENNLTTHMHGTYNDGEKVAFGQMMAYQTICVNYYGTTAQTIQGQTWSGPQCPGNNNPGSNGSTYNAETNTCTCKSGLWNGGCTAMSSPYLAIPHSTSPYVTIYDTSNWNKLANPSVLPTGNAMGVDFSPNGNFMVVTHTASPFVTIYNTSDWSKVANPTTLPDGDANEAAFSPDGSLLAIGHATSQYLTIYNASNWSKVSDPASLPAGIVRSLEFSPDGKLLAVAHDGASYLKIYKTSDWSVVTGPSNLPSANATSVTFSADGSMLAVGYSASPYMAVYDTITWDKLAVPATPLAGIVYGLDFSPGGTQLAVAHAGGNRLTVFNTNNWSTVTITSGFPPTSGEGVAFSPDGATLAVTSTGSDYLTLYNVSDWSQIATPATPPAGVGRRPGWAPLE